MSKCQICGEPMPEGEEMFNFHGYSGECPKEPLEKTMCVLDVFDAGDMNLKHTNGVTEYRFSRESKALIRKALGS